MRFATNQDGTITLWRCTAGHLNTQPGVCCFANDDQRLAINDYVPARTYNYANLPVTFREARLAP